MVLDLHALLVKEYTVSHLLTLMATQICDLTHARGSVTDEKWSLNPATPKARPKTKHQTVCVCIYWFSLLRIN